LVYGKGTWRGNKTPRASKKKKGVTSCPGGEQWGSTAEKDGSSGAGGEYPSVGGWAGRENKGERPGGCARGHHKGEKNAGKKLRKVAGFGGGGTQNMFKDLGGCAAQVRGKKKGEGAWKTPSKRVGLAGGLRGKEIGGGSKGSLMKRLQGEGGEKWDPRKMTSERRG